MQEPDKQERVEDVLRLSDRLFRELLPIVPKELLDTDLTMPQLKVVLLLFLNGPARMSALASALGVSLATTSGIVDRLVERDIIIRENLPEDRRVVLCHLSDAGQELTSSLWRSARERAKRLLEAVPASELDLIAQALEALSRAGKALKEDSAAAKR